MVVAEIKKLGLESFGVAVVVENTNGPMQEEN
jgi:hypothetical protein